jgi:hypothetical protein
MNRRQVLVLFASLSAVILLAYLLRGIIWDHVILPLAEMFWQVRIVYHTLPQIIDWVILLVVLVLVTWGSFSLRPLAGWRPEEPVYPRSGDIQQLAVWLERRWRGVYSRWHIANTLANIALDMLRQRTGVEKREQKLTGPGWNPPAEVQAYLEAGLRTPYMDYRRRGIFSPRPRTPLDSDLEAVVGYLESLVENEHEHQHS